MLWLACAAQADIILLEPNTLVPISCPFSHIEGLLPISPVATNHGQMTHPASAKSSRKSIISVPLPGNSVGTSSTVECGCTRLGFGFNQQEQFSLKQKSHTSNQVYLIIGGLFQCLVDKWQALDSTRILCYTQPLLQQRTPPELRWSLLGQTFSATII